MAKSASSEAPDRHQGTSGAMFVCWILGIGALMSWNSMLTVGDYYYTLFPDYHPSRVLTLVYQPFALGTMAILAYHESKMDNNRRSITGYILFSLSTFTLIVLDLATAGKGGVGTYIGICACVALFGVAEAHVQGGIMGDISYMRPKFVQSFVAGLSTSGVITSGMRLMTKAAFSKGPDGLRQGAMMFLAISTFIEFLCIFLYAFVFLNLPVVRYYRAKVASEGSKTATSDLGAVEKADNDATATQRLTTKELFFQNIDYFLGLFLIYVLSLSIFPGFLYENTGKHHLGSWYPLVLIAMFNVMDLIGRYIPLISYVKLKSRKGLMIVILSRYLFIPAFYFTAKYGDEGWMMLLVSVLGLSNGYLTVCIMTEAPKGYKGAEQNAVGNLLVLFLLAGLFAGVALDWLWLIGSPVKF